MMRKLLWGILAALLLTAPVAAATFTPLGEYHANDAGASFTPIPFPNNSGVYQNVLTWGYDIWNSGRAEPPPANGWVTSRNLCTTLGVPTDATAVRIHVKAKAAGLTYATEEMHAAVQLSWRQTGSGASPNEMLHATTEKHADLPTVTPYDLNHLETDVLLGPDCKIDMFRYPTITGRMLLEVVVYLAGYWEPSTTVSDSEPDPEPTPPLTAVGGPHLLPGLPAVNSKLVFNSSWDKPIQYLDGDIGTPPTSCASSASELVSHCEFSADLPSFVPAEATYVLVRIKAVAQLMPATTTYERSVFVLAYAWDPSTNTPSNHLVHTEVWGNASDGQSGMRRDIDYSMAWLPVVNGKVYLRTAKRILPLSMPEGAAYAALAVTIEGYWTP